MLTILIVVTIVFAVFWMILLHALSERQQRFLCRHQWLFLAIHLPVMYILSAFMGEGMIVGVGSLAGGLLGQIYLAFRGMKRFGLTFLGRRTNRYYELYPKKEKKHVPMNLRVSRKVLEFSKSRCSLDNQ